MSSILTIARITISEFSSYRLNFLLWRFRMVIRALITYSIWQAIFVSQSQVGVYSKPQMFTYLIVGYLISALVMSSRSQDLGDEINSGKLSNALLRPQNYLQYMIGREVGDKLVNVVCSIIEVSFLFLIFHPEFILPSTLLTVLLFGLATVGGTILYFLINTLLSLLGFWTTEVWASRFIFFIFLEFFTGWIVPPDLFPSPVKEFVALTPFPYIFFFPSRVFLGNLESGVVGFGFGMMLTWCVGLSLLCLMVWKRGMRKYGADGR